MDKYNVKRVCGNVVTVRRKNRDDGVVVVLSKVKYIIIRGKERKEGGGYCLVGNGD